MQDEMRRYYTGVLEDWKIDLALGRIRAMGFAVDDWPDLMQELVITMLDFRYEPAKSNGAVEETALFAVVSRRLLHLLRTRCRGNALLKRYARLCGPDDEPMEYPFHPTSAVTAKDIANARQGLSEFDNRVCSAVASGANRSEIARELGCDWHTVDKAIGRIAAHFTAAGLKVGAGR